MDDREEARAALGLTSVAPPSLPFAGNALPPRGAGGESGSPDSPAARPAAPRA
jgi:hypothetical protein